VNSLPKTVTRQRRRCDLNPGPSAPESSTLTTLLPSHYTLYMDGQLSMVFNRSRFSPQETKLSPRDREMRRVS